MARACSEQARFGKLQSTAHSPHEVLLNLVKLDSVKRQVKQDSEVKLPKYVLLGGMMNAAQIYTGQQQN